MLETLLPLLLLLLVGALLGFAGRGQGGWRVKQQWVTITATTRGFSYIPTQLTLNLGPRGRQLLRWVYDLGALVGIGGIVAAVSGLLWTTYKLWSALLGYSGDLAFIPKIPGLNAPWSDLPTLLAVILLAELLCESGHVLCAALDDISPTKVTISVHGVFPLVKASLPTTEGLVRRSRARIVAAGPFHLVLIWLLLTMTIKPATPGRRILAVGDHSGLDRHIQPGDRVTHVNDVAIGNLPWADIVNAENIEDEGGWCIPREEFLAAPLAPSGRCTDPQRAVFEETPDAQGEGHCLPFDEVVSAPVGDCACLPEEICVLPQPEERIMRLRYFRDGYAHVFVWRGQRSVLLDLTITFPHGAAAAWLSLLVEYLRMVALLSFLFKLLPVRHLAGTQLIDVLFGTCDGKEADEAESGNGSVPRPEMPVLHRAAIWLSRGVTAILSLWAAGLALSTFSPHVHTRG